MSGLWPTLKGTLEASEGGASALLEYLESWVFPTELHQELLLHTTLMYLMRYVPETPLGALEAVLAAKLKKGFFFNELNDRKGRSFDRPPFHRLSYMLFSWPTREDQSHYELGYNYTPDTGLAEEAIASLARDRDTGTRNFPYFCKLIDLWAKYQLPINYTRAIKKSVTNYSTHHLRYLINLLNPNIADVGSEAFLRAAFLDPPSVGAFDAMRLLVGAGLDFDLRREKYGTSLLAWALFLSATECKFDTADRTHFLLSLATNQGETISTSAVHKIATFIFAPRETYSIGSSEFESLFTILKILEQYGLGIRSLSKEISLWCFFKAATSALPIVEEAFRFLLSRGVPLTTFALSVMIDCRARNTIIDQILSARVAVDFTKEEVETNPWIRYTPLQLAVLFIDLALVKRLVRLNANVNAFLPISGKYTALGLACLKQGQEPNTLETIRYLISKGAEVNTGIRGIIEPLEAAATSGNLEAASLLLAHGASVTQRVLENAAWSGRLDMISLFLEKGEAQNVEESVLDIHKCWSFFDVTASIRGTCSNSELRGRGYDKNSETYADAVVSSGKSIVDEFMHDHGNDYFTCEVWEEVPLDLADPRLALSSLHKYPVSL
ncbi:hypothetical protein GQ53DRAFT_821462 [Thozetella sp. PMI_491]|nr:hypothetical protein GQ53DRAFT_821462 [Thozetella sp. PMI_491]